MSTRFYLSRVLEGLEGAQLQVGVALLLGREVRVPISVSAMHGKRCALS